MLAAIDGKVSAGHETSLARAQVKHERGHLLRLPEAAHRYLGDDLNISSIIGSKGGFGQTNYAAAKAGMHGFTKSLALEVAKRGVMVNTISPGYIATKMVTAVPQEILDSRRA